MFPLFCILKSLLNGSYQNPVGTNFPVPRHPNVADRSWSKNKTNNGSGAGFQHPYHHQEIYTPLYDQHHQYGPSHPPGLYGHPPYGAAMNSQYYPHQFEGYNHHPPHIAHNIGYQHGGETGYSMPNHTDQFGHNQFYNGYYPSDGNFHDGMGFDTSIHAAEMNASYMHPSPMAQTPNRYHANELHGQFPVSPYWGHLNISQLPGLAASPSMHHTPSKPPRGNSNRSFRKRQGKAAQMIDGKAKSLIMFPNPNQTNSPASRFVMSPQDKSNPYYANKSHNVPNASSLNQSGHEESFVLPTIEDYSADSPAKAHTSLHSDVSMHLMPPAVKKIYSNSGKKAKESGQ